MNFCRLCGNLLKARCVNVLHSGQIYCGAHSLTLPLLSLPVTYACLSCIKDDVVDEKKSVKLYKL